MEKGRMPRPGEIYNHFKDKLYQVITIAFNSETKEPMVVYQALYGDFKAYVRPLEMFISEVDHAKYPEVKQKYRFELRNLHDNGAEMNITKDVEKKSISHAEDTVIQIDEKNTEQIAEKIVTDMSEEVVNPEGSVNVILLKFLDAESYSRKLEVITSNVKHLNDRLINDMAVSLDCAVNEGPLDQRIQGLIYCLQAMCRFEDKRLR